VFLGRKSLRVLFARLGVFFNKSVCQQENSIDQRNIGSIVEKFFGPEFLKFAFAAGGMKGDSSNK